MEAAEEEPNNQLVVSTPVFERERPPLRYAAPVALVRPSHVAMLATIFGLGLLLYLAVEPTKAWMLLVVTGVVIVGTDGILRQHPYGARESDATWTAPLLFLPGLFALGSGLFLEDVLTGYWVVPGAIVASVLMGIFVYSDFASIEEDSAAYPGARVVLNIGTFLTAFSFYAVVYTFDVSLVPAAITVGLISLLLGVEILREAEADPFRALVFAGVGAVIVAEARCVLYFLPLESYLAAAFLLIVFYLVSGLVQHHLNDDLDHGVMMEFSAIALIGVAIVAVGRIFESGS